MENIEKRRIRFPVASIFYFFVSLIFVFNLVTILSVDLVEGIGRYIAAGIINTVSAFLISGVLFAKNRSILLGIAFFLPLLSDVVSLDFLGIISSLVMLGLSIPKGVFRQTDGGIILCCCCLLVYLAVCMDIRNNHLSQRYTE